MEETMNWKPGMRALIVNDASLRSTESMRMVGEECLILARCHNGHHDWDIDIGGYEWVVTNSCLRPIPPDDEEASWEAIKEITQWSPQELVT